MRVKEKKETILHDIIAIYSIYGCFFFIAKRFAASIVDSANLDDLVSDREL